MSEGESPAVYREMIRKARKIHKCCECHRQISPGNRYQVSIGNWEGRWAEYKTCYSCYRWRNKVISDLPHMESVAFETLDEYVDVKQDFLCSELQRG